MIRLIIYNKNKGIESITYNVLNLADCVLQNKVPGLHLQGTPAPYTQESIRFLYDSNGEMLSRSYVTNRSYIIVPGSLTGGSVSSSSRVNNKVDYCGNFIYENDSLSRILIPDGYVSFNNGAPSYYFYAKDHQGNNRVVADQNGAVKQVNHYYPFGGLFGASSNGSVQGYKFSGKELERMHGLDWYLFGNRMQDPILGRFPTMDRFCEKYYALSPYQFAANNPVNNLDVNGDSLFMMVERSALGKDGFSTILSTPYYFHQLPGGDFGFSDKQGQPYTGDNQFVSDVSNALNELRSKPRGRELVDGIVNSEKSVQVAQARENSADSKGTYIKWSSNNLKGGYDEKGSNLRPPYIGLGHELAHIEDIWRGTYDNSIWGVEAQKEIPNAEKYGMHIENQLRSEHNIPLRILYGGEKTRFLHPLNNTSLFYREIGPINRSLIYNHYNY